MIRSSSPPHAAAGGWVLLAGLALLPACANLPYVASTSQALREPADLQTGSNLTCRERLSTGAREMDKGAIEFSLRGTNANRDTGR